MRHQDVFQRQRLWIVEGGDASNNPTKFGGSIKERGNLCLYDKCGLRRSKW